MRVRGTIARLVAVSVVLCGGSVGVVALPAAPAHALECWDGWLRSEANHKYVAAELNFTGAGYGELRARSNSPNGPWEQFEFCWGVNQHAYDLSIRSIANGKWVAVELNYTGALYGMLRARSNSIGPWEQLYGGREIQSRVTWKWVAAELQYTGIRYGMLRARTVGGPGPWEDFSSSGPPG